MSVGCSGFGEDEFEHGVVGDEGVAAPVEGYAAELCWGVGFDGEECVGHCCYGGAGVEAVYCFIVDEHGEVGECADFAPFGDAERAFVFLSFEAVTVVVEGEEHFG